MKGGSASESVMNSKRTNQPAAGNAQLLTDDGGHQENHERGDFAIGHQKKCRLR
jgi:hypothetical protein